jgi:uncharacterized membrane protein
MMQYLKLFGYGFIGWAVPFIAAFPIFQLKQSNDPLFETIMAVTLVLICAFLISRYFKKINENYITEGIKLGFALMIVSLLIDIPFFIIGPFKMPLINYIKDIGLTYLIFPIMTISSGYLLEKKYRRISDKL